MKVLREAFGDNDEQVRCASWGNGPLMVLAGPGVGKTRMLTHRIAHLLRRDPRAVFRVLALTFTNKSAQEMTGRLRSIRGFAPSRVWAGTFHSFCTTLLRNYSCYIGRSRNFGIIDTQEQLELIEDLQGSGGLPSGVNARNILSHISRAKSNLLNADAYAEQLSTRGGSDAPARFMAAYQERLRMSNLVDFDDLIALSIELLAEVEAIRRIVRDTYRYVLVDECQDTTLAQHRLLELILAEQSPNLFAVADEHQSIYEWNNARIQNLRDMIERYGMEVMNLQRSYRCPPEVLRLANRIILGLEKTITGATDPTYSEKRGDGGETVRFWETASESAEAQAVANFISDEVTGGRRFSDFCVIGRTRFVLTPVEDALSAAAIPFVVFAGTQEALSSPVSRLFLSAMKFSMNPNDAESLKAVIATVAPGAEAALSSAADRRLEGKSLIERLEALGEEPEGSEERALAEIAASLSTVRLGDPAAALSTLEELLGLPYGLAAGADALEAYEEEISTLRRLAEEFRRESADRSIGAFLGRVALEKRGDVLSADSRSEDRVRVMTVHTAKGTENPIVLLVGLEEGNFPHYYAVKEGRMDEERRSFYVAMTRAEETLVLSCARTRTNRYGRVFTKARSAFLDEVLGE